MAGSEKKECFRARTRVWSTTMQVSGLKSIVWEAKPGSKIPRIGQRVQSTVNTPSGFSSTSSMFFLMRYGSSISPLLHKRTHEETTFPSHSSSYLSIDVADFSAVVFHLFIPHKYN